MILKLRDQMIMQRIVLFLAFMLSLQGLQAQGSIKKLLKEYNDHSVPYITHKELHKLGNNVVLLDSRELKEYKTSHLKQAIHVGYDDFK